MGKALSTWERSRRAADRERERERASHARARERKVARDDRAKERASIRREREDERELRKNQRERELESARDAKLAQIEGWRSYVATFDAYLRGLSSLHRVPFRLAAARAEYENRSATASYVAPSPFEPGDFPQAHLDARKYPAVPWRKSLFAERGTTMATLISLLLLIVAAVLLVVLRNEARWCLLLLALAWVIGVASVDRYTHASWKAADKLRREAFADQERRRAELLEGHEHEHKKAFAEAEAQRLESYEFEELQNLARFDANEASRVEVLDAAKDGALAAIGLMCEAAFPISLSLTPPADLTSSGVEEHAVAYDVLDAKVLRILIEAPDDGLVPDRRVEMTPSNDKMRFKEFAGRARAEAYESFVASLALRYVAESFRAVPSLEVVVVEVTVPALDPSTGRARDHVLAQGRIEVGALSEVDLLNADPVEAFRALGGQLRAAGKKAPELSLIGESETVTWATVDDVGFDIPHGLLPNSAPFPTENAYRRPRFDYYDLAAKREAEAEQDLHGMVLAPMRSADKDADHGTFTSVIVGGGLIYLGMVGLSFSGLLTPSRETGKSEPSGVAVAPLPSAPVSAPKFARVGNTGGEGVFLRKTADPKDKLRAVPDDTKLELTGNSTKVGGVDWSEVSVPEGTAWIPSKFLIH